MEIHTAYKPRTIKFIEIIEYTHWQFKLYGITMQEETLSQALIDEAKQQLPYWIKNSKLTNLSTHGLGTLILHKGKEGCFAIINWWIDENMLQHFVYLKQATNNFELYSANGIITCVWELAVLWHERNAWVMHVLEKYEHPDKVAYLNQQLNITL